MKFSLKISLLLLLTSPLNIEKREDLKKHLGVGYRATGIPCLQVSNHQPKKCTRKFPIAIQFPKTSQIHRVLK